MDDYRSLKHTKWECRYHVVFIRKCRRKKRYKQLRQHLGEVFRQSAQQKEGKILEGHLIVDHVHMLISIPPKYAVAQVIGCIKGKSAIHIARTVGGGGGISQDSTSGPVDTSRPRRSGREGDPEVHPATGTRGSSPGPDEDVRLTAAASGSQTIHFERFPSQASGSARGIDYCCHPQSRNGAGGIRTPVTFR
jgi:putative transposase